MVQKNSQFQMANLTPAGNLGWLTGQLHISLNGDTMNIIVKFGACGRVIPVAHMRDSKQFRDVFLIAFCNGGPFATP
jgi:hypothetical protein